MDRLKEIELGIRTYNQLLKNSKKMLTREGVVQCVELRSELINQKLKILKEATVNEANPVCGVKNCNEPVYEFGRCFKHYCQSETT